MERERQQVNSFGITVFACCFLSCMPSGYRRRHDCSAREGFRTREGFLTSFAGARAFRTLSMCPPPAALACSSLTLPHVLGGDWHWRGGGSRDGRNVPGAPAPDIVFIGLQEVDMSPLCLVSPSGESERGTAWQEHLSRQINKHLAASGDSYTLITAAQLCTVAAFAFVRSMHTPHVSSLSVRSCSIGVDLLVANVRNKAAIELRFAFAGAKVAFVSAHFAPHEGHCDERCGPPRSAAQPVVPESSTSQTYHTFQLPPGTRTTGRRWSTSLAAAAATTQRFFSVEI